MPGFAAKIFSRLAASRILIRAALILLAAVLTIAPPGQAQQPESRFDNLQVLPDDSSPGEVFRVMKLITRGLGVECRSCHRTAQRDFGTDELAMKGIARAMMRLEQARRPQFSWRDPPDDLCMNCHQGQLRPPVPKQMTTGQ